MSVSFPRYKQCQCPVDETYDVNQFSTVHTVTASCPQYTQCSKFFTVHTVTASFPQYTRCQMFVDGTHGERKFSIVHTATASFPQ